MLESERADRRQAVLQGTTVGAVGVAGLANIVRPCTFHAGSPCRTRVPVLLSVSCWMAAEACAFHSMLHMAMPIEHLDFTAQATQFGLAGHSGMAWAAGLAAAACGAVVYRGLWRVRACAVEQGCTFGCS